MITKGRNMQYGYDSSNKKFKYKKGGSLFMTISIPMRSLLQEEREDFKLKNQMRRTIISILLVCLFALQIPMQIFAATESNNAQSISTATTDKYNIELLIDKSGSMNATDGNHLAKSAACQFVDQMCTVSNDLLDLSAVTSVGVMTFSQTTKIVTPITSLDTTTNTNYLKSEINNIKYDPINTGGTDLSIAIYDALKQLEKTSVNDEKNMVVLFTDGFSENVLNQSNSDESLKKAFELAEKLECEIYVVGLNYKDKIKDDGRKEIYNIANTAQRKDGISEEKEDDDTTASYDKVNYLITSSIGEVREFYGRIYANMIQSDLVYIENHEFIVDSTGILEADVTVYSNSKINNVVITDPDGNKKVEDGKTYFVAGDDYYKVIKIMNPIPGKWSVDVTSKDDDYKSYVVQFYGVEAAVVAEWDTGAVFTESGLETPFVGKVTMTPMYKDAPYTDDTLADESTVAEFIASKDSFSEKYSMKYSDGKFVGYFPVEQGTYDIEAHLENPIMDRTVNCKLSVTNTDGVMEIDLGTLSIKRTETIAVDLLEKTGKDSLIISEIEKSDADEEFAEIIDNHNGSISINGLKEGNEAFTIFAQDNYKLDYIITGNVSVVFKMMWYHWLLLALLAMLMVIGGIVVWSKTRKIPGYFTTTVELVNPENPNAGTIVENDMPSPTGSSFSLWKLMNIVKNYISNLSDDECSEGEKIIGELLNNERLAIAKSKIVISENIYKKKIYKNGSKDLTRDVECYKSSELSVKVRFASILSDEEDNRGNDEDWGLATDFKKSDKKRGRRASATFDDED